jgi:F-type H+-transporting ATPase subunit a
MAKDHDHHDEHESHGDDHGAHGHDPFDPGHLFGHVQDADYFEVPRAFSETGKIKLPQPLQKETPIVAANGSLQALELRLTKFMVLEVVAALIVIGLFVWLAGKIRSGERPRGRLWNLLESMLLFIRDEVARPAIGHHDADKFLPFLWTIFFFALGCNLLGMVPWAGSPTGSLAVTGVLALITFTVVVGSGMQKMGVVGFWTGQVPHMDLPLPLAIALKPMVFVIEVLGMFIKHGVLAIRLLANMMAGHLVLAVIMAFILAAANSVAWYGVAPASILGATALSMLELFVAFLQAYIFTFLSALFIGMAVHPH